LSVAVGLLVVAGIAASFPLARVDPAGLVAPNNGAAVARFIGGLFPPELAPVYLWRVAELMGQTAAISLAGTALAIVAAIPLALAATRRRGEEERRVARGDLSWALRWARYALARAVLNVARAVPEIVWALVFVVMVGLGPFPGVLALAIHSAGILGKLWAETLEGVDQRAVEAIRATGATEGGVTALARFPLALPVLLSYTLFRWECNLRAATVLGVVGAGGIGTELVLSFKLFRYHELLTLILAILLLIALVDLSGQLLRARLLDAAPGGPGEEARAERARQRTPWRRSTAGRELTGGE